MCADSLNSNDWFLAGGPMEAAEDGTFSWSATGIESRSNRAYRVEVRVP